MKGLWEQYLGRENRLGTPVNGKSGMGDCVVSKNVAGHQVRERDLESILWAQCIIGRPCWVCTGHLKAGTVFYGRHAQSNKEGASLKCVLGRGVTDGKGGQWDFIIYSVPFHLSTFSVLALLSALLHSCD